MARAKDTLPSLSRSLGKSSVLALSGNPDDLEEWELKDPVICHLRDKVLRIREEKQDTLQQLESVNATIDALDQKMKRAKGTLALED